MIFRYFTKLVIFLKLRYFLFFMIIDVRTMLKNSIIVGMYVRIALHKNQEKSKYEEGVIEHIITENDYDPDGVDVKLETGYIGHVKEIINVIDNSDTILQRIQQREDQCLEKKETFSFDVREEKRNDHLKKIVCVAVASMLNTKGGYVYVGVNDDGIPTGLKKDFSIIPNGANNDKLEMQIRAALSKNLANYEIVSHFIEITFPCVRGIEICEIRIKPSSEPIFLKTTNYAVSINESNKNRRFDDFYIRDGNGKKLLEEHQELLSYWKLRFGTDLK